jgi:PAS domain S-box-containing protein
MDNSEPPDSALMAEFREREVEKRRRLQASLLRALWRSEAHRRLAESNIIGVLFVDTDGRIRDANDEFLRMLGYARGELSFEELRFETITPEEYRAHDAQALEELLKRGVATPWEKEHVGKGGMRVPVLVGAALLEGSDHKAIAFVLDLTERKRAEERAARYAEELEARNHEMQEDLRMAREIQQAFLPHSFPRYPSGNGDCESALRFSHRYFPAGPVGGDFFDVLPLSDTQAGLLVCDVMGHGVRAALMTGMIRTLVEQLRPLAQDAGRMLTQLNRGLFATLRRTGAPMFVTACYAIVDGCNNEVQVANAGHPSPFALRRSARRVEPLGRANGPAMGILDGVEYSSVRCPLATGDGVLIYTDGLFDVDHPIREESTPELIQSLLEERLAFNGDALLDALLSKLRSLSTTEAFADDVCLVQVDVVERIRRAE